MRGDLRLDKLTFQSMNLYLNIFLPSVVFCAVVVGADVVEEAETPSC